MTILVVSAYQDKSKTLSTVSRWLVSPSPHINREILMIFLPIVKTKSTTSFLILDWYISVSSPICFWEVS